ncbi:hypothetical protein GCM10007304_03800 [Rhodococcoides trifolii]|uniref:Acetyl xylan esterase domain-containing protein n=1 Tax=Rhodococcoides trifolii TaxID=908250 RepID=A0A917CPV2_9NOCA|nr:hypothetical protein [Rhodococcus trifolii]GGF93182.1 hypothetical protein GCM10007304_03800 [Rhodococcus trifolii]
MGTHDVANCPRSTLRRDILRALGMPPDLPTRVPTVTRGRTWTRDGVDGTELRWASTHAWLLRPAGTAHTALPAVLLMHGHDGVKRYGKEKVADGPDGTAPGVAALRRHGYDDRSVASGLVGAGFVVLVHDVFPWGSRRVEWDEFPERARRAGALFTDDSARYEAAAREHEHGLAKIGVLTGRSLAAQILFEDVVALSVLRADPGVDASRVAATGFSGGGARVAHLLAAADLAAGVITASMSTFADIADGHADDTTWSMISPGLPAVCDWPDVAASAAPSPLLVQFARGDTHFGAQGMRGAEVSLQRTYQGSNSLTTQWFDCGHRFTADMQDAAARWLSARMTDHP